MLIVLVISFYSGVALCLTEFRPQFVESDNVLIVVLLFLPLVLNGCLFFEVAEKWSKLDGIS